MMSHAFVRRSSAVYSLSRSDDDGRARTSVAIDVGVVKTTLCSVLLM